MSYKQKKEKPKPQAKKAAASDSLVGREVWILEWHTKYDQGADPFATFAGMMARIKQDIEEDIADGMLTEEDEESVRMFLKAGDITLAAQCVTEADDEIWWNWDKMEVLP